MTPTACGRFALVLIVVLGGAWRLLEARARLQEPLRFGDEYMYFAMGVGLREGGVLGDTGSPWQPSARRAPLYPSLISFAAGDPPSLGRVRLLQAALSTFVIVLAWAAGASLHSPAAGLAAAGLCAANAPLARFPATLYIETVYGFFVLLAAWSFARWAARRDARSSAELGAAVGAGLLCRSNLLLIPAAAAAWHLAKEGRRGARAVTILCACAAAPLAPWALRNAAFLGRLVWFEDGVASHIAYLASTGAVRAPSDAGFAADRPPLLEEQTGALMSAASGPELEARMRALARGNLLRHPGAYAAGWLRRAGVMLGALGRALSWPVLALVLLGVPVLSSAPWRAVYVLCACYLGLYSLFAFQDRYLVPLAPALLLLAGASLVGWARRLLPEDGGPDAQARTAPALALAGGLAVALVAGAYARLGGEALWPRAAQARTLADRGWSALRAGDAASAEAAFAAAEALLPRSPEPRVGLAEARLRRRDIRARADVEEAIRLCYRPWASYLDDWTAAWAAAAFDARSGYLEARGRRAASAADRARAAGLRAAVRARWRL